nr:uncharacterized protein LOC120974870 [Aegilops tauschii subsp. strangulata]
MVCWSVKLFADVLLLILYKRRALVTTYSSFPPPLRSRDAPGERVTGGSPPSPAQGSPLAHSSSSPLPEGIRRAKPVRRWQRRGSFLPLLVGISATRAAARGGAGSGGASGGGDVRIWRLWCWEAAVRPRGGGGGGGGFWSGASDLAPWGLRALRVAAATAGEGVSPSQRVWRRHSVRRLGRAGRRVGGGLGFDLKLAASPRFSSSAGRSAGFLRTSCSAGWRSNGDASSGSGETLDRRCWSRCWRCWRRRSPSGGRHRDPLLASTPWSRAKA